MSNDMLERVRTALALPHFDGAAAQRKMTPAARPTQRPRAQAGKARLGGVLLMLYCKESALHLLLTRRRDDLNAHAGQISFPGGRHEAPETLQATALREAYEEVGVMPQSLEILGALTPLYIPPSDFEIHPFVAWARDGKRPSLRAAPREVAELIEVPLSHLLDPTSRSEESWNLRGQMIQVPFFAVSGHKVWGATAMVLSEFLERLRALESGA